MAFSIQTDTRGTWAGAGIGGGAGLAAGVATGATMARLVIPHEGGAGLALGAAAGGAGGFIGGALTGAFGPLAGIAASIGIPILGLAYGALGARSSAGMSLLMPIMAGIPFAVGGLAGTAAGAALVRD